MKNFDSFLLWWYDEFVRQWLSMYYLPLYIAGKSDEWAQMGLTLNGAKPICRP